MTEGGIEHVGHDSGVIGNVGHDMGESGVPAWVEAGSGRLTEEFDGVVRFLPEHASLLCSDNT